MPGNVLVTGLLNARSGISLKLAQEGQGWRWRDLLYREKQEAKTQLGFLRTNWDWEIMDWDDSISFIMALLILSFSTGFLGSLPVLVMPHIGISDYMIFQVWLPWLTHTFCVYFQHRACGSAQALDYPCGHPSIMLHCLFWGPWVSRE